MGKRVPKIFCAECEVALEMPTNADPNSTCRCPRCGVTETLKNVVREVQQGQAQKAVQKFKTGLRKSVSTKKGLKLISKVGPKKHSRFFLKAEAAH